jgi:hypothetical protein
MDEADGVTAASKKVDSNELAAFVTLISGLLTVIYSTEPYDLWYW